MKRKKACSGKVRTVTGDIEKEKLGYTQCHEHVFLERDKSAELSAALLMDDYEKSVLELKSYHVAGGCALVDAQPVLCGRMAELYQKASKESGVSIIGSTGFHKTVFYYQDSYIFKENEEFISRMYIDEIQKGMLSSRRSGVFRTDAKAGLIKTAVDSGGIFGDAVYEKLHRAAAAAHRATGMPLMCHTEKGADMEEITDFYLDQGVAPECLILAHLDRTGYDPRLHEAILKKGIFLEYDTIMREKYHSNEEERTLIAEMLKAGYERQILLSLDTTNMRLKSYGASFGLDYILKDFVPFLLQGGITAGQIQMMMVSNPARALSVDI